MVAETLKETRISGTDPAWRSLLKRWLGFSLVMHIVAAVFSAGYYDADEQFQILEFLNARLGRSLAQRGRTVPGLSLWAIAVPLS